MNTDAKQHRRTGHIDILVIGAGFAGLSTAWHLAKKGVKKLVVIEHDHELGGHASGRNAGMIRQAIADPVIAALAAEGRKRLSRCGRLGWPGVKLVPNGSLLLAKGKEIHELKATARALKNENLHHRWLTPEQAIERVPLLRGGDFEMGLFCESDAMVDIVPLLRGFYDQLRHKGIPVMLGHSLARIERKSSGFHVSAGKKTWVASKIVNAAGAWASAISHQAKAYAAPLKAYRRHLFVSTSFQGMDKTWPFVWDLSHNFYFRPQDDALLLSPCDKGEVKDIHTAVKKEKTDSKVKKLLLEKLKLYGGQFEGVSIESCKSGLRTMTPDGRFVIGEDPKLKNFFWVAGLGGHGVTTCFSVGDLASDLIMGRKRQAHLVNALSPQRFTKI